MSEETQQTQQQQVTTQQESQQTQNGATVQVTTGGTQIAVKDTSSNVNDVLDKVVNEDTPKEPQQGTEGVKTEQTPQTQQTESSEQGLQDAKNSLDEAEKDLTAKGVDFNALEEEFTNNGSLSQESYNKLANAGYPKAVVDGIINGWQAASDRFVNDVMNIAGGKDEFQKLQQFVSTQPQAVIDGFNAAIDSNNLGQIQLAIAGLKSQMVQKYGSNRPIINGNASPSTHVEGYTSRDAMIKDMSDPRYQTDPAFTEEVYRKVKYSKLF